MNATKLLAIVLLVSLSSLPLAAAERPLSAELVDAIYQEETAGDLDKAIEIYERILKHEESRRGYLAQATFRLGSCYLKKGNEEEARKYLQRVVEQFPQQTVLSDKAQQLLATSSLYTELLTLLPQAPYRYIAEQFAKSGAVAQEQQIRSNAHVYGVDAQFNVYRGGLSWLRNPRPDAPSTGPISHGHISYNDVLYFDRDGRAIQAQFTPNPGGPFRVFLTPSKPLEPGEVRMIGWIHNAPKPLPKDASGGATLPMQNFYGSEVLETFFLVVPASLSVRSSTSEFTTHKNFGDVDVYVWQDHVPASTNHRVEVLLAPANAPEQDTENTAENQTGQDE